MQSRRKDKAMDTRIREGMMVVCTDNEHVEALLTKHKPYIVREVSHRGALLTVQGITATLASSRFAPLDRGQPPMEVCDAGN